MDRDDNFNCSFLRAIPLSDSRMIILSISLFSFSKHFPEYLFSDCHGLAIRLASLLSSLQVLICFMNIFFCSANSIVFGNSLCYFVVLPKSCILSLYDSKNFKSFAKHLCNLCQGKRAGKW